MPGHDIVVIGTSAGGVEALARLVAGLPAGFPAGIFVVCHFPPERRSRLPEILSRSGPLLATHARDGEPVYPGQIYVAPPDYHLILEDGLMRLGRGPRENRHRPAIDPLFRSAARTYGPRVIAVVLTGSSSDGVAGLLAVRAAHGIAVVQDEADAVVPTLPRNARAVAGADHVVPASDLANLLVELVQRPVAVQKASTMPDPLDHLPNLAEASMREQEHDQRRGRLSIYTCPECGGAMWQVDDPKLPFFRCHTGHTFYGEDLLAEQGEALETALWSSVRTFRERTVLARQLAARERARGDHAGAERFEEQAQIAQHQADLIQKYILHDASVPVDEKQAS